MTIRVDVQCRAEVRGNKLGGYASVFDQTADLGFLGQERIAKGAFDNALKTSDVRALWNHSPLFVLGRQSAGTLRLRADDHGLEYEVDLPNTSYANDLRELVERGDITGASFGFVPGEFDRGAVRTHTSVADLVDVSPVTFPAYTGASTEARAISAAARPVSRRSQLIRLRAGVLLGGDK